MAALGLGRGDVLGAEADRPNLLNRLPGNGSGPSLAFNGHVDTKPVGDARPEWLSDPLIPEVRNGRLYGLGACDMKAAVAAMTFAAAALRQTGRLAGDLVLAFVADEEAGAARGAKWLAPRLQAVDACLIGEPSGWEYDWQGLHVASRGLCCFRIVVEGTQMHSSLSDRMPSINASRKMADLLREIDDSFDLGQPPHPLGGAPTLNTGVIVDGGVFFGVVPGRAEFACDLRVLPGITEAEVHGALEAWLDAQRDADPQLRATLRFEPDLGWIAPSEISVGHPLVEATRAAADLVLEQAPPLSVFPGTCDAPWFAQAGIPTIPAFGPGILTCAHGPNEYVELDAVHQAARIYAHTAALYCGGVSG
jgi:acetylornithine deacetylase